MRDAERETIAHIHNRDLASREWSGESGAVALRADRVNRAGEGALPTDREGL